MICCFLGHRPMKRNVASCAHCRQVAHRLRQFQRRRLRRARRPAARKSHTTSETEGSCRTFSPAFPAAPALRRFHPSQSIEVALKNVIQANVRKLDRQCRRESSSQDRMHKAKSRCQQPLRNSVRTSQQSFVGHLAKGQFESKGRSGHERRAMHRVP
jgi:hypothetical protein